MLKEFLEHHQLLHLDRLAVGVSGGADSLALALMLQEELSPLGIKVIALTVDHQLRKESTDEAFYVARIMKAYGIEHHILVWEGGKPLTGIEEAAREARYQLLKDWCFANQVKAVAVAHQAHDQAETFLMRLQRGSGLDGLCGMRAVSVRDGLLILRPLLNIMPEELRRYLQQRQLQWVEDPSNQCNEFLRVRARKFMPLLEEKLGITPKRLVETMHVLQDTLAYVQEQTNRFIKNHVRNWDNAGVSFSVKNLDVMAPELLFRVLSSLILQSGGAKYKAEAAEIKRLMLRLPEADFTGCTLGGCEIIKNYGQIWIVPELKIKSKPAKKVWEDFVAAHPKYKKIKIPYKLRLSLLKLNPIYK